RQSVEFLGHIVSVDGIHTDPGKTEKISSWPVPQNVEEVRAKFNARSVLGAPLISQGESLGALMILDCHNPNRFDGNDQINASLLANQAAIAIVNARLFEQNTSLVEKLEQRVEERTQSLAETSKELRQERDRFNILYDIARQLTSSLDLDPILNQTLLLMGQSIHVSKGSILLVSADNGNLIHRASLGGMAPIPRDGQETRFKVGEGLAGYVLETLEPLIVPDLAVCEHWIPSLEADQDDRKSALAIPLVSGFDGLGIMILYHTEIDFFNEDHLNLVTAAAPMIATAISNANLFSVITEASERVGNLFSRVQAEANKNEAIIEAIADGVMVIDREQNILLINPAMATILNLDRHNLVDEKLRTILSTDEIETEQQLIHSFYEIVTTQQAILTETEGGFYTERIEIDKKALYLILSPVTFSMEHANQPSTLIVVRDISREAEIDRIKNEFISTVSHELRTPMTSIKGYLDLLVGEKVGSLTEMQHHFLGIILNNADRLTNLVNDILEISGLDAGQVKLEFSNIDLKKLIENVVTSFAFQIQEKNLTLTLNLPDDLPNAYADESRVMQVLYNLVGNATKYTHPDDCVTVNLSLSQHLLQVDVSDTGLGISEEDLEHVFERFYRAESDAMSLVDGTGLGLPIAKMFVERMGGEIWVESTLGVGSTFSFTLPITNENG
ncbi:MAG: ATP-binding protein, partial [Chloroflexota bacterium]